MHKSHSSGLFFCIHAQLSNYIWQSISHVPGIENEKKKRMISWAVCHKHSSSRYTATAQQQTKPNVFHKPQTTNNISQNKEDQQIVEYQTNEPRKEGWNKQQQQSIQCSNTTNWITRNSSTNANQELGQDSLTNMHSYTTFQTVFGCSVYWKLTCIFSVFFELTRPLFGLKILQPFFFSLKAKSPASDP